MPIPPFNSDLVLPPHLGDPRQPDQLSPYPCSSLELCQCFHTSPERRAILDGFLRFRARLDALGVLGFQWLDGSFLEDIEAREARPPGDLDVVTFYHPTSIAQHAQLLGTLPEFNDNVLSKLNFHLDHFPVDISFNGLFIVEAARYWTGLFSHRRGGVWKGMLRVELGTSADDVAAAAALAPAPALSAVAVVPPTPAAPANP